MMPNETPPPSKNKKQSILVGTLIVLLALAAIPLCVFILKASSLQKQLSTMQRQLRNEQNTAKQLSGQLRDIAFYVHPDYDYGSYRQKSYAAQFTATFPKENLDPNWAGLARVYYTSGFRQANPLFNNIQNDDVIVFDARNVIPETVIKVVVVRPRDQKIIASGTLPSKSLRNALAINKSPFPDRSLNKFSDPSDY